MMSRWIFLIVIIFIIEFYTFFAVRTLTKNKLVLIGFWIIVIFVYAVFFYQVTIAQKEGRFSLSTGYAMALLLTFSVPKLVVFGILFLEDIFRFFASILNYFQRQNSSISEAIPSRRKFISQIALGIAAIPFASFVYGVFRGKYNFKVLKQTIYFDDLPDAFDGYQLTQISDIHSGSLDNKDKVEYAVNLINEQKSDMILFTGDMVNAVAEEMNPWVDSFKKLDATDGMYAVLGNHDYGYYAYRKEEEIAENQKKIEKIHKTIGFDLLLNESRTIEKKGQRINILGVENWGASRHFPKRGSLKRATENIEDGEFNILLSHDPSHFDYKEQELRTRDKNKSDFITDETNIIDFHKKIQLTLSGHTHGMQFGIEIPSLNIKWSPVKYRYHNWAGLYKKAEKYLYVNRGFGVLAFPGRVGIWPEITVIELKKS